MDEKGCPKMRDKHPSSVIGLYYALAFSSILPVHSVTNSMIHTQVEYLRYLYGINYTPCRGKTDVWGQRKRGKAIQQERKTLVTCNSAGSSDSQKSVHI